MTAAYRGLADEMKQRANGLMAINSGSAKGSKERASERLVERGATADELVGDLPYFRNDIGDVVSTYAADEALLA